MFLYGSFINKKGNTVKIEILTENSYTPTYEIDSKESGIYFPSENPVIIESEINDTFDVLLTHSATIRLESAIPLTELFCSDCMDAVVSIRRDNKLIFAGFVVPQTYSQSFNNATDEIEINCIDGLSALQYIQYGNIRNAEDYATVRQSIGVKTFEELINACIDVLRFKISPGTVEKISLEYDESRALTPQSNASDIFKQISVSELLFLGDNVDEVWTMQDVLKEILLYLDLHIEQEGGLFRIFSWDTAKSSRTQKAISMDNVADTGTTIEIGETYNQISLTCQTEELDIVIESPLDENSLYSPYNNRQKYMTSYGTPAIGSVSGVSSRSLFNYFVSNINGTNLGPLDFVSVKDWYIRVKNNPNWKFYGGADHTDVYYYIDHGRQPQDNLPTRLCSQEFPATHFQRPGAALISWGYAEQARKLSDNSKVSGIDMADYLVIKTGCINSFYEWNPNYPDSDVLKRSTPVAEYKGTTGFLLSLADDEDVCYLLFKGSIRMSTVVATSFRWGNRQEFLDDAEGATAFGKEEWRVNCKDGERWYARKWWRTSTPGGTPFVNESQFEGLLPPDEDGMKHFHVEALSTIDNDSKFPVLACMLIIGDKCLVSTDRFGSVESYQWVKYKEREECASDEEYYSQVFTIGIDPKPSDYLVGDEFEIQNNVTYDLGLDEEGMAIPIRKSDNLHGDLIFRILGPVNMKFTEKFYDFKNWWEGPSSGTPMLPYIENIYIKNFEAKLTSSTEGENEKDNCDLIYISDTDKNYVNRKNDITFRLTSALTADERTNLEVKNGIYISTPTDMTTEAGLLSIYDTKNKREGKPEQLYVDAAYTEMHLPLIQMQQTLEDDGESIERFDRYAHPALSGKKFFTLGISRNLMAGEATLKLREIG